MLATLEAAAKRKRERRIDFFVPNEKQLLATTATREHNEVMLRAGNQQGKSEWGGWQDACHLTGDYPKWWTGRRFTKPITAWVAGVKGTDVRDIMQAKLCGEPGVEELFGTGFIPKAAFKGTPSLARGVTDLYDTVHVKHLAPGGGGTIDGISSLRFKTYPEEQRGFQGKPVDLVHLDEEPHDMAIFEECQARTIATNGLIVVTLTPKKGRTALIDYFELSDNPMVKLIKMGLADATHLSAARKEEILAKFAHAHDREAILYGNPVLGEGKIFTMPLEAIQEPRISNVPREWRKIWGIDFGIDHPFAAVLLAYDIDTDTVHLLHGIRMAGGTPLNHVPAVRAIAAGVPVAWPHDGHKRDAGSGIALAAHYRNPGKGMQGLDMLGVHATHESGGNSLMGGIDEINLRCETGRFKVSEQMVEWGEEYNFYHYENGQPVAKKDDLLSATRYALMMKRYAKPVPLGSRTARVPRSQVARDLDFNLFGE